MSFEQPFSPESLPVSEQEVIEALDAKGVEDPGTKELLDKYAAQCEKESEAEVAADPENPEVSNRANIKSAIKLATLYSKTKYRDEARQSLEDVLDAASQSDSTQDLADQIISLLDQLE